MELMKEIDACKPQAQKDAPKVEPVFDKDDFPQASLMTPKLRVWSRRRQTAYSPATFQ